jgi:DNA-binding NarL/FixJ family response regulator
MNASVQMRHAAMVNAYDANSVLKKADVLLLDSPAWATLAVQRGVPKIEDLSNHGVSVALIASVDRGDIKSIQARGIRGLLPPDAELNAVVELFEHLFDGRSSFRPDDHATLESQIYRLSNRELQILRSLCRGQSGVPDGEGLGY